MKAISVIPHDRKEFEVAFSLLTEFGKERKLLSLKDDEDISFAFLIKHKMDLAQVTIKTNEKKSGR